MKNSNKDIQYPPQTGMYKVCVIDKGGWQKYRHARLQISIGNIKHDGEKFFALAEWASTRFEHVTLIVSDSLQRHNIALSPTENYQNAHEMALKYGDEWLERNKMAIDLLPHKTISRWDEWLYHPQFLETYDKICRIVSEDEMVKILVDDKVQLFTKGKDLSETFLDRMLDSSRKYILEELAVFAIMLRGAQTLDVYPGTWFKELFETLSKYKNEYLLDGFPNATYIKVDFLRNKAIHNTIEKISFNNN